MRTKRKRGNYLQITIWVWYLTLQQIYSVNRLTMPRRKTKRMHLVQARITPNWKRTKLNGSTENGSHSVNCTESVNMPNRRRKKSLARHWAMSFRTTRIRKWPHCRIWNMTRLATYIPLPSFVDEMAFWKSLLSSRKIFSIKCYYQNKW